MDHEDYDRDDKPSYRESEAIGPAELRDGLQSLALFWSDTNMRQQALNLSLIDQFLMQLETQLLRTHRDEKPYIEEATFLTALSQMWIFAAYELLRTWQQRANDLVKWADNGGLQLKLAHLREDVGFTHFGREMRARQIEKVIADPTLIDRLRSDLRRIHMPFARIEALRVSIAKHEVRGRPKSVAFMPVYGRINMWCGSLDYELSNGAISMGTMSRRDVADNIRSIPQLTEPTDEEINSFDQYMRGPSAEELDPLFSTPPEEV